MRINDRSMWSGFSLVLVGSVIQRCGTGFLVGAAVAQQSLNLLTWALVSLLVGTVIISLARRLADRMIPEGSHE